MLRLIAAVAVLAALLAPAPARAATITLPSGGSTITITSGDESDRFYASVGEPNVIFGRQDDAAPDLIAGGECFNSNGPSEVTCPTAGSISATMGAGNDKVDFASIGARTIELHGGPGNDELRGGPLADQIFGEGDTDYLLGEGGADTLDGGEGNDSFGYLDGADVVTGGPGTDAQEFYGAPAGVNVSLDDVANDSVAGAATANVRSDVETVQGSAFADTLTGNAGPNELNGNDGNDTVTGGSSVDILRGDNGDDRLDSADEFQDDIGCGDGNDFIRLDPRDRGDDCETIEVVGPDADGDGSKPPLDCDDTNPAVKPGGTDIPGNGLDEDCSGADAPLLDADQDGVTAERDCDDGNAAIRPGAVDRPGNGVDEDCDGADDPYPLVVGSVAVLYSVSGGQVRITLLRIAGAQPGARVQVRCRGRGCPFARKTIRVSRGRAVGTRLFRGVRLGRGAVLEVRLTATDTIGKVRRLTVRAGGRVRQQSLCLKPGSGRPSAC